MRAALLVPLVACSGADLRGTWSGDLDCGPIVFEAQTTLDKREKGIFEGPLALHSELTDNQQRTLITDIVYDIQVRAEKVETQDLQLEADFASLACAITNAQGDVTSTDCSDANLTEDAFVEREADLSGASWDAADTITVDVPDGCVGDLTRPE